MIQDTYQTVAKFAAERHANQQVKGSSANYMLHLSNVAMEIMLAYQENSNFDLSQAVKIALLHDTIEDTNTTFEEVATLFGHETAKAVQALTKDKSIAKEKQMEDSLQRIKSCCKEAKLVKIADRIVNLQKPPKDWNVEKRRTYREQALLIYDELHGEHSFLDKRLKNKIENYKNYIEEKYYFLSPEQILDLQKVIKYKTTNNKQYELNMMGEFSVISETWSRDTGHMWQRIRLKNECPSDEERDFADLEDRKILKIKDLSPYEMITFWLEVEKYER